MATKTMTITFCCRCNVELDAIPASGAAGDQGQIPVLYLETTLPRETSKIKFDDLCTKCTDVVGKLLDRIELSKSDEPKARKAKKDVEPEPDDEGDDDEDDEGDED